jgi:CheY-like chemotaxis protein
MARLRQEFPAVKAAVVTSGYSNDPVLSDYRNYGFNGVIVKPFKIEDLREALQAVLQDKRK